ncbi:hypothetical protein [uncultured Methanoregula sp.]|uniref:hypothetical protein n=1 Tax=uncultured Methanoregula sp. TaxID=1005933 RepID=UPI002AAB70C6|nr:hypothetical protein [uncultured Methanoregula sp.]
MTRCPYCGNEIFCLDIYCPFCKKPLKNYFFIPTFLLENFRLFTIIGVIGAMIALIPSLGTQILGAYWISDQTSSLPLFLSIMIFFGAYFIAIVFASLFVLIFQCRDNEIVLKKITIPYVNTYTFYRGDYQRLILLFCLVPLLFGIISFLIPLLIFIQNIYSWFFAFFVILVLLPSAAFAILAWLQAKNVAQISSEMGRYKKISYVLLSIMVIECLILINLFFPITYGDDHIFSNNIKIEPSQDYFSPQISSDKGLRLEIANFSGRESLISMHNWSASYGYFIWVSPTTPEVRILGNPVNNTNLTVENSENPPLFNPDQ